MKDRFYLSCLRETVGTNMSFHCVKGEGYSTNLALSETYTRVEVQITWNTGRVIELPISADQMDALAVHHIDHQHIPGATIIEAGCVQHAGFVKGNWDGNDVYWLCEGRAKNRFQQGCQLQRASR
jgi:hypothetical protein